VVGFTTGSRGKVPGKTCEKRIINNNNNPFTRVLFERPTIAHDAIKLTTCYEKVHQ
jgi:hypothetical protein